MSGFWRLCIEVSNRNIFTYGEMPVWPYGALAAKTPLGRERKITGCIAGSRSSANSLWQGGWRRAHSVKDCLPKWNFFSSTLAGWYRYTRYVAHWLPKWIWWAFSKNGQNQFPVLQKHRISPWPEQKSKVTSEIAMFRFLGKWPVSP